VFLAREGLLTCKKTKSPISTAQWQNAREIEAFSSGGFVKTKPVIELIAVDIGRADWFYCSNK
jgi:hypothetical protein